MEHQDINFLDSYSKDLATSDVVTVSTDDNLFTAFEKINVKDFSVLPVAAPEDSKRLWGLLPAGMSSARIIKPSSRKRFLTIDESVKNRIHQGPVFAVLSLV